MSYKEYDRAVRRNVAMMWLWIGLALAGMWIIILGVIL